MIIKVFIIKVFIHHKIVSGETFLCAHMHTQANAHMNITFLSAHMRIQANAHRSITTDYLIYSQLKQITNRDLRQRKSAA